MTVLKSGEMRRTLKHREGLMIKKLGGGGVNDRGAEAL